MITRALRRVRPEHVVLAVLGAWVLLPAAALVLRPLVHGGIFTGVTGIDPVDEYQYLAWIRDSGLHGLAANLFDLSGGGHVFLQPMYLISGLLWRLGIGLQLAYLLWAPVAVVALWAGFWAYARRMGTSTGRRIAILAGALFFTSPLGWFSLPLTHWTAELQLAMSDGSAALQPTFAFPAAIAIGLTPFALLGAERLLAGIEIRKERRRTLILTSLAGAAVAWLHSWQGLALLIVLAGGPLLRRPRRTDLLILPVLVATGLPIVYQYVLTQTDAAWRIAEQVNDRPDLIAWTPQLAVLGPLLVAAIVGLVRAPPRDDGTRMLALWPLAAVLVYRFDPAFPPHALQGIALPLLALAVRGWPAWRPAVIAGLAALVLLTVPGLAYYLKSLPPAVTGDRTLYFQTPAEHDALAYLASKKDGGAVLAPYPFALEVPAYSDHPVWDGHPVWTTDPTRPGDATVFFGGGLSVAESQSFLRRTSVRWVLFDCPVNPQALGEALRLATASHQAGCATLVRLR